jgi:hypothetical protein
MMIVVRWTVLAIVLATGCDRVFGLGSVSPPADAAAFACVGAADHPAVMCADFESGDQYLANGTRIALPPASAAATGSVVAVGTGHALAVESHGGGYVLLASGAGSFTTADASLRVRFDRTSPSFPDGGLLRLTAPTPVNFSSCYVNLVVTAPDQVHPQLFTQTACNSDTNSLDLGQLSQLDFVKVELHVDFATGRVTTTTDSMGAQTITMASILAFSRLDAQGQPPAGLALALDDIVVTAQ